MPALDEIFQLEGHLEDTFEALLKPACENVYHSRETDTAKSPRIEVKAIVGSIVNHVHNFPDNIRWAWNGWQGRLETGIYTNRQSEDKSRAHNKLLGLVRAKLQMFAIVPLWRSFQSIVILTDIREAGTEDSFIDANDIDVSKLTWDIWFNIAESAWPKGT